MLEESKIVGDDDNCSNAAVRHNLLIYNNFCGIFWWIVAPTYGTNNRSVAQSMVAGTTKRKGEWDGKPRHSRIGSSDLCGRANAESQQRSSGLGGPILGGIIQKPASLLVCGFCVSGGCHG